MSYDLALVLGTVISIFAIPAIVSAFSDGRTPRAPALMILIGGGLLVWALMGKPGGYTLDQLPEVFIGVVQDFL